MLMIQWTPNRTSDSKTIESWYKPRGTVHNYGHGHNLGHVHGLQKGKLPRSTSSKRTCFGETLPSGVILLKKSRAERETQLLFFFDLTHQKMKERQFYNEVTLNEETSEQFCIKHGLISAEEDCDECGEQMKREKRGNWAARFVCQKNSRHADGKRKFKKSSTSALFQCRYLTIQTILTLLYGFIQGRKWTDVMNETGIESSRTISRYFRAIRQSIIKEMSKRHDPLRNKIGGDLT